MNLQQFMDAVDCRVCGGSEFQWDCFPNGRYMDISDLHGNEVGTCLFSTMSQEVYEIVFDVYDDDVAYRWTDPIWAVPKKAEADFRGIDNDVAYTDDAGAEIKFTEIESEEEILKIVRSITHMTYVHFRPLEQQQQ